MSKFLLSFLLCFNFALAAQAADCDGPFEVAGKVDDVEHWYTLGRILVDTIGNKKNPFLGTEMDSDAVGRIHKRFRAAYPTYNKALKLRNKTEDGAEVKVKDYNALRDEIESTLGKINKTGSDDQQFAALETLRIMAELESRLPQDELENPTSSEDAKADDGDEEKEDQEKQPAEWNEVSDHYSPEQTDLGEGGAPQENVEVVAFNTPDGGVPIPYLRQRAFDIINADDLHASPGHRPRLNKVDSKAVAKMTITPLGNKIVTIPVPYGLQPITGKHSKVHVKEEQPGIFTAKFSGKGKKFEIPLALARGSQAGLDLNFYTKTPNIPLDSWPQNIQDFVASHQGQTPKKVVEELTAFLQKDGGYLYYSKGDKIDGAALGGIQQSYESLIQSGAPKAVAMAHAGAFNCDGAAMIATQILRQYFKIPTRVAEGRTVAGFRVENNERIYASRSGDPLHAWIEVWAGSDWIPYDPTPTENQPDNQSDSETEEKYQSLEESEPQESQESQESESSEAESSEAESSEAEEGGAAEAGEMDQAEAKKAQELEETKSDLFEELKGRTKKTRDYGRFLEQLHVHILEKYIERGDVSKISSETRVLLTTLAQNNGVRSEVHDILNDLASLKRITHDECLDGFMKCMQAMKLAIASGQDLKAYGMTGSLIKQLQTLSKVRKLKKHESDQLSSLRELKAKFQQFNHPNAEAYERVMSVYNSLPGRHSREMMINEFKIDSFSPSDVGLLSLDRAIQSGKAKTYVKLAAMKEYADLYIKSVMEPGWDEMLRLQRSPLPNQHEGIVIARSPLEINRMMLNPKPNEHIFAPLFRGEQFAMGPRETTIVASPRNPVEHKMSVVMFDISGSMGANTAFGTRAELQSYLINSFVDLALSETDRAGRPIHHIVLVPFDGSVHPSREVKNKDEATAYLNEKLGVPTAIKGSTNIQGAINEFMNLAEAAYADQSAANVFRRLRDANLVLFSDGGGSVDAEATMARIDSLPEDLRVHMNFVAIDQTNAALEKLTKDTTMDSARPSYRHMGSDEISRLKGVADSMVKAEDPYYSEVDKYTLRRHLDPIITKIERQYSPFITPVSSDELLEIDRSIGAEGKASEVRDRILLQRLVFFRESLQELGGVDRSYREALMMGVASYYLKEAGRHASKMTIDENNALKLLLRWARE